MHLDASQTDHINELLALLVAFTKTRCQVLVNNLRRMDVPGFSPQDLAIEAFSKTIDRAISEHLLNNRIVLCDTDAIHFGPNLSLELDPVPDPQADRLLQQDRQGYIEYQTKKLLENALHEKLSLKLLQAKQQLPEDQLAGSGHVRFQRL